MKAARFSRFGPPDVFELVDLPDPLPGPGQVRVAVRAVGVSSTDCKQRQGALGGDLPQTSGRDLAGIVDRLGEGVTDVAVGDRVFGLCDETAAAAEFALVTHCAPIPSTLGFADAAALPSTLETATRSLDTLGVTDGCTLLVNGAAGAIGATAVQLARARGARVIGVASVANYDYVRGLGGEPVYGEGLVERVRTLAPDGVDRALDVVGNDVLAALVDLTGTAEHVVTIADFAGAREHHVRFSRGDDGRAFHALRDVADLVDTGRFWLPVERTFPLSEIAAAHRLAERPHRRGKVVLLVDPPRR